MLRGTNFGGDLQDLVDHNLQIVRDGPAPTPEDADIDWSDYARHPELLLWYIVGAQGFWRDGRRLTPDDMTTLTQQACQKAIEAGLKTIWLECCNEPNRVGAGPYAGLVNALYDAVAPFRYQLGVEVTCCSVGRLNFDNLRWVETVINAGIPTDVMLSPHDYPIEMNPDKPEPGFRSVPAMFDTWQKAAKGRDLVIGESGYWDGEGGLDEAEAMLRLGRRFAHYVDNGVKAATTYQHRNGSDMQPINRCGLKREDGTWKEHAAAIFPPFDHAPAEPEPITPLDVPITGTDVPREGTMKVALRYKGNLIGVNPSEPDVVYADRSVIGEWEHVELAPMGGGLFSARFLAANVQLAIEPDGLPGSRPAGDIGAYETFNATQQPDGSALLYRVLEPQYIPSVYTIEEVA